MRIIEGHVEVKREFKFQYNIVGAKFALEEGDTFESALLEVKKSCEKVALEIEILEGETIAAPVAETKVEEKKVEEKKAPKAEKETAKKSDVKSNKEDAKKEQETHLAQETSNLEKKEETPKTTAKKGKNQPYDRTNDKHKFIVGGLLDGISPGWRQEKISVAKEVSAKINGTDFLNSKGEVLEEFEVILAETFKKHDEAL